MMKIIAETPRLILRHFIPEDASALFELDSNPKVLKYLGMDPIDKIEHSIADITRVQKEYESYGVGRVAVVLKETNEVLGWAGLKFITSEMGGKTNFYDIGYRFIERYWGKGYGYEAAKASVDYGFNDLGLDEIYGMAMLDHKVSRRILEKIGLQYFKDVDYEGVPHAWYRGSGGRELGSGL